MDIQSAWLWYDAIGSIYPKRGLRTRRAEPKYLFLGEWSSSLLDALTDGRPLLMNFHVADTFKIGTETKPGAILYNCLFKREGRGRMKAGLLISGHNSSEARSSRVSSGDQDTISRPGPGSSHIKA